MGLNDSSKFYPIQSKLNLSHLNDINRIFISFNQKISEILENQLRTKFFWDCEPEFILTLSSNWNDGEPNNVDDNVNEEFDNITNIIFYISLFYFII